MSPERAPSHDAEATGSAHHHGDSAAAQGAHREKAHQAAAHHGATRGEDAAHEALHQGTLRQETLREDGIHQDGAHHPAAHHGAPRAPLGQHHDPRLAIGLALGGGAARGFAHIGVLKALERHGIRPQMVAGTSIGAVVGGLWAAGKLDALEEWALSLTKRNLLGFLDFTFNGAGLIAGRRLMERMRREIGDMGIEHLPVPFTAVATECGTGHEIWLTRGDFVTGVRASYALPGIFTPAKVGGRWLMDGALVNPIPVSPTRAKGARFVIAVDLNADTLDQAQVIRDHGGEPGENIDSNVVGARDLMLSDFLRPDRLRLQFLAGRTKEGPGSVSSVMIDAFNITQDRITRARFSEDPPDITLAPKLHAMGLFDFHRAREAIDIGMTATEAAIGEIRTALALAEKQLSRRGAPLDSPAD